MKITGVDHTSYTVSNLERSLEFYVGVLGCQVLWQREIDNPYFGEIVGFPGCVVKAAHLSVPGSGHHIELFEYLVPTGNKGDLGTNNVGVSHLMFEFGGARVGRVDVDFLSGPTPTGSLEAPSAALVKDKQLFGSSRRARWFGL